jgi:hypothetical protein
MAICTLEIQLNLHSFVSIKIKSNGKNSKNNSKKEYLRFIRIIVSMFYTNDKNRLRQAMNEFNLEEVRFSFDYEGTKIILS